MSTTLLYKLHEPVAHIDTPLSYLRYHIIAKQRYLKRIDIIFYQFDPCEEPEDIWENTLTYNNTLRDAEEEQYIRTMAKHTPNFEKEAWKYLGLEILGVEEFNWKNDNINPNSVYERLHCNDTRPSGRS